MHFKYLLIFFVLFSIKSNSQISQIVEEKKNFRAADSLLKEPSFSVHKDNYFLTGVPINTDITRNNADVKYQVSFKLRLNSKPLWGGFFPYLMYTQKAFWDIYASSKPFSEINFNIRAMKTVRFTNTEMTRRSPFADFASFLSFTIKLGKPFPVSAF